MTGVSVIVPVYNGEKYIDSCCQQIMAQTLKNIELIIVDDGSTDRTWEKLLACKAKYPQILILHQENRGAAAARNYAIQHAHGEYIGFVDVDDVIEQDMFESLYNAVLLHDLDLISMEGTTNSGNVELLSGEKLMRSFLTGKMGMSVWSKLFRRTLLTETVFPEGKRVYEDFYAVFKAILQTHSAAIIYLNKYHYIQREGSSSRALVFTEKYFDAIDLTDRVCEETMHIYPELEDFVISRKAQTYLRISKIYYKRKAPVRYRQEINTLKKCLQNLDTHKISIYFKRTDRIRYYLYLYCKPLFLLLIHTIDRK